MDATANENGEDSTTLATLVKWHEDAEQATVDAREEAQRARDYYDDKQYTPEETAILRKRKQPIVTNNRIKPKINYLLGQELSKRADPKAYPRTPDDDDGAQAATDAMRFVCEVNNFDRIRSKSFEQFCIEGACGIDVCVYEANGGYEIDLKPIYFDRMWWDPHSRENDFSDAKYLGQFRWMDLADAEREFPGKKDVLSSTVNSTASSSTSNTYDDSPKFRWWDSTRRRIRIAECWSREDGTLYYSKYTLGGILERQESPYKDANGKPQAGFVFGSAFVDGDGDRYGVVRSWFSLQDEINKRRSKALHLMNVRQTYGNQGAGDTNKLKAEMAKPDGHIELEGGARFGEDFGVLPTGDMAAAQFQLLQEAKAEIDGQGVNAALTGTDTRQLSGRAQMVRQESGMTELGPLFANFEQFNLDVYRQIWNRIKQFWTAEKWVRVTDNEKNVQFIGLNQPLTAGQKVLDIAKQRGMQVTPEMLAQLKADPRMSQVVGVKNNLAEMDIDIIVDSVPAAANLQAEQFAQLMGIAPAMAQAGKPIPIEAIIRASGLRDKDKIIEAINGGGEGQKQGIPPQVKQMMDQAKQIIDGQQKQLAQQAEALKKAEADAMAAKLDRALDFENLQIKRQETEIKALDAQTKARSVELDAQKLQLEETAQKFEILKSVRDAQMEQFDLGGLMQQEAAEQD